MPKYCYKCNECELEFETWHAMKDEIKVCELCGADETIERIPAVVTVVNKNKHGKSVGETTRDFIESSRADLEQLKRDKEKQR